MRRRLWLPLAALLVALVAGIAVVGVGGSTPPTAPPRVAGYLVANPLPAGLAGRPAPRFSLPDGRGGTLASASLRGRPYAVTFLYTSCPDVCPLIGEELHAALARLGPAAQQLNVVGLSVDPRGDNARTVRAWLAIHHEPPNFHYLIGSQARLAPVWRAYAAAPQIPGDPQSSHTAAIWLIDRRGRLVGLIDAGMAIDVGNLAHDLRLLAQTT